MSKNKVKEAPILATVGSAGFKRSSRTIDEEWHKNLRGKQGRKVYREMSDNDPIIGSTMRSARYLMRQA